MVGFLGFFIDINVGSLPILGNLNRHFQWGGDACLWGGWPMSVSSNQGDDRPGSPLFEGQ